MRPLIDYADRHPASTGILGALSGFLSYVLSNTAHALHEAAGIAADIGILLGCAASFLTVLLLADRYRYRRALMKRLRYGRRPGALDPTDHLP